ncbi:cation:proton antiporter [Pedococcus sp. NPDC057267]|uniref:cation:proton antiporter n=1 Tax=Pedococcus sp. NPDC057267 TaxID=3346077 RepID=UPI0036427D4A
MGFGQLALICAVALLGALLSLPRALRLPVVVGELAVGIALGATGLRVLSADDPTFHFLAEIGFALVMFVAGSHVPVRDPLLLRGIRSGLGRALLVGVLAAGAGAVLSAVFGTSHTSLYAVLLASSSASVVMPVLGPGPFTARSVVEVLPQVAVADAACIVLLPLALDPGHAGRAALGALVVAAAAAAAWWGLRWAHTSGRQRAVHRLSEERELAIELRLLLSVLFALAALAVALDVSVLLAGFALGLVVAAVGEPRRVAKQLFAVTEGLFAPIFFVWLGASLDLRALSQHPSAVVLGLALGAGAVAVHGAMVVTGQPWSLAVATSAQLGVPVAAATLGRAHGLLVPGEDAAILLGALVTIAATALASNRLPSRRRAARS